MHSGNGVTVLIKDTMVVTMAYLVAFCVTFKCVLPVQNSFFPEFSSHASLLFLPHGVRVLAAWLLGWRSVIALAPGVVFAFWYLAGNAAFTPSRLFAILVAITVPAATFYILRLFGLDLFPKPEQRPCWPCIVIVGGIISVITASLTNIAFGSSWTDVFAYLIGDFFGLFFLMAILMFTFRGLRRGWVR